MVADREVEEGSPSATDLPIEVIGLLGPGQRPQWGGRWPTAKPPTPPIWGDPDLATRISTEVTSMVCAS
ncbi:hypothetical protein CRG98_050176 [Punica granatum]|uniref:Uncharacterized protein n=1 Tax=Punica granatum TaxID=22663 RepID=A0A2I0GN63_PUNGR|nr:hypothetical protein CRG98_050176 [Punica granatum]